MNKFDEMSFEESNNSSDGDIGHTNESINTNDFIDTWIIDSEFVKEEEEYLKSGGEV